MLKTLVRLSLVLASYLLVASVDLDGSSSAKAQNPTYSTNYDLFYNYYVGPPGVPAGMYPCPRPTPPFVGHTYITYQPFLPQQFLYQHHRRWCGGGTVAEARYWR